MKQKEINAIYKRILEMWVEAERQALACREKKAPWVIMAETNARANTLKEVVALFTEEKR